MLTIKDKLESLQKRIANYNESDTPVDYLQHLTVTQTGSTFNLEFYGDCFDDSYYDLLNTVATPDISTSICSLIFRGFDRGANGTHNWDIEPLIKTDARYINLKTFSIQLNKPTDRNRSIVATNYDEDGVIARLISKSPQIQELTVPSAPNSAFFNVGKRPISFLSIDAGYDTQNFISNLANSSCFPDLKYLEWGEYNETYINDYLSHCTTIQNYKELFQSKAFASVKYFVWRNPVCTDSELKELKKLRPDLRFFTVQYSVNSW